MKPLCSAKSYNPFHRADVIEAPSAALKGQDDNSPGQARHERRPGKTATKTQSPFFLFCPESIRGKTGKREVFIFGFVTPGGAPLARGYYHIVPTGTSVGLATRAARLSLGPDAFLEFFCPDCPCDIFLSYLIIGKRFLLS